MLPQGNARLWKNRFAGLASTGSLRDNLPDPSENTRVPTMPLLRLATKLIRPDRETDPVEGVQAGAIPYRLVEGQVVFLMITSRRSANWIFPKGTIEKNQTPAEAVAQEAFEEAGVRGEVGDRPVGAYLHPRNDAEESMVRVELFPLHVTEQLDDWPEEPQRFRHWALLPQVRRLMASRKAACVAAEFNRRMMSTSAT